MPVFNMNQINWKERNNNQNIHLNKSIQSSMCGDALWVEVNAGLFFYDFKTEMPRPSFPGDFF